MSRENHVNRRGAPRPLPAGTLQPPAHLSATQREFFRAAVRGRDGYWLESDTILLCAYAVTADYVQSIHCGAEVPTGAYVKALKTLAEIMRVLRLSPAARDTGNDAVAPPAGLGGEAAAAFVARNGTGEAVASPPPPSDMPAWSRAAEAA